jgi:hypothetical protein
MMAVGPYRLDLAEAALGHLQPPSVGQDWELQDQQPATLDAFSSYTMDHTSTLMIYYGLFANILPATGFGLDLDKLPDSLTNLLLVSMGKGEINGTDVRRLGCLCTSPPLHSCHVMTTAAQLLS